MMNSSETPKKWSSGMRASATQSLAFRLLGTFIAIIVIVLAATSLFAVIFAQKHAHKEWMRRGETMANLLSAGSRIAIFAENRDQLRTIAGGFAVEPDVLLVAVYNGSGKPLYASNAAFPDHGVHAEQAEKSGLARTMQEEQVSPAGVRTLEFSKPVALTLRPNDVQSIYFDDNNGAAEERVIGFVKIVLGRESLNHEIRKIVIQNSAIALVFICASIVIVSVRVRTMTKPLETLTQEVKTLAKGNAAAHVPVKTMDEVGRLAMAFNVMLDERTVSEQTRKNILRDLHDGIGGNLTNIILLSEISQAQAVPEDVVKKLATISTLSRDGIEEIRNLIYSLDRRDLNWSSLIGEIRSQGYKIVEPHGIAFEMTSEVEEGVNEPGSLLCVHLLKIYRESLNNVMKHSHAKMIIVNVSVKNERLMLTIKDDGQGCEHADLHGKGRGVANMKSRAAEIGGLVTITSSAGTCVAVDIPFPMKTGPFIS